jgi:hypothetical protein
MTRKLFLVMAALVVCLPAAGQEAQNDCRIKEFAAANPKICGTPPTTGTPLNSTNGSSPVPQNPCNNKDYASAHPVECRRQGQGSGNAPASTCTESCGPTNDSLPTGVPTVAAPFSTQSVNPSDGSTTGTSLGGTPGGGGGIGGSAEPPIVIEPRRPNDAKRKPAPANASARCHDGFYTKTVDLNLACSKHGGIEVWLLK